MDRRIRIRGHLLAISKLVIPHLREARVFLGPIYILAEVETPYEETKDWDKTHYKGSISWGHDIRLELRRSA